MNTTLVVKILVALALGLVSLHAAAQITYPDKPVRIIVPFPPGGTTDVVARLIAAKTSALWSKTIFVDNRSGASGTIGTGEGIAALPDGYTLTMGNSQTHGTNAALFPTLKYDLIEDVQPIAMLARTKNVLAVSGNSPFRTVDALIQAGKTRFLSYASVGNGSSSHIIGEFITRKYGLKTTHVPYRGGSPAVLDLIGGQVDFMAASYGSVAPHIKDGKVRILAVSADEPDPRLPGIPTFKEAGLPSFGLDTTIALYAPTGIPRPIVTQWSDALRRIVTMPDFITALESQGFEVWFKPANEFEKFHRQEVPRLKAIIKEANVEMN